jgi:RimJ/RimL family protein N-acetyltransferase
MGVSGEKMKNPLLTYRPIAEDDAAMLLRWRTDPAIAQHMLTEVSPDLERQRAWVAGANARGDFVHRIMEVAGAPVGYCSITVTDTAAGIGAVGVYVGERSAPVAVTAFNFIHILNHAFFALGLHKMVNQIVAGNDRVIPAQKFNGYRHVGTLREQVVKQGGRHDLLLFEQLAEDWKQFRRKFGDWRDLDGRDWPP